MPKEILYQDDEVVIGYLNSSPDDNYFSFGAKGPRVIFQRGVLEELAKTRTSDLKEKLHAIDPSFEALRSRFGLSYDDVFYVITQARINELEEQLSKAIASLPADEDLPF